MTAAVGGGGAMPPNEVEWRQRVSSANAILQRANAVMKSQHPRCGFTVEFSMMPSDRHRMPVKYRAVLEFAPIVMVVYEAETGARVCESRAVAPEELDTDCILPNGEWMQ